MAKLTTAEFIDAIKELSVLELNDLVVNPGGLAIYGGVLGGVVVALIYRKEKRISPFGRFTHR